MKNKKSFFTVILILSASGLLTACGGGGSSSSSSSSGSTITLTGFPYSTVSGLAYSSIISNSGFPQTIGSITIYFREWNDTTGNNIASMMYYDGGTTVQYLSFNATPNGTAGTSTWYYAGAAPSTPGTTVYCQVSGSVPTYPTCSSIGISVDRVNGTITFVNTPAYDSASLATGTMSGSLNFGAF